MKLRDLPLAEFLETVASQEPVPGGGSAAALLGGLSASLASMVARLTIDRGDEPERDRRMASVIADADELRLRLEEAIDLDADAYGRVMAAYGMSKGSEAEKGARTLAVQEALRGAATIPLAVARMAIEALHLLKAVVGEGNSNAVTDGMVGAMAARSGALAAALNVRINLAAISDASFKQETTLEVERLEREAIALEQAIIAEGTSRMLGAG